MVKEQLKKLSMKWMNIFNQNLNKKEFQYE